MQSVRHSIPRCVLAQSYLDDIHRSHAECGDNDVHMNDRNTDQDAAYVHVNEPQKNDRMSDGCSPEMADMDWQENQQHHRFLQREKHHYHRHPSMQHDMQQLHPYSADRNPSVGCQQPPPQHYYQQSNQRQMQHHDAGADAGAFGHHYHRNLHVQQSRLEEAFPPLHDHPDQETAPRMYNHRDGPSNMEHLTIPTQKSQAPSGIASRIAKQQGLLPPPIQIPKVVRQHQHQQPGVVKDKKSPVQTRQLPSPAHSASSPESPSSLAIHLYVHHHLHHHSQQEPSPVTAGRDGSGSDVPSAPLVLLSPLTLPSAPTLEPLESKDSARASLPSPPSPTLQSGHPMASLLPPLPIPNGRVDNDSERSAALPWFTHPSSLANTRTGSSATLSSSTTTPRPGPSPLSQLHLPLQIQPRIQPRRRPIQRRQLPDPVLATQLLSTISPEDLARLYVHAAHHLHSHQPIRRYVMMKMIMTQAELAQFGRLRAEMPRAPGPSTGAQPRRIGFGSDANTGLAARPKVPSKLGMYMATATSGHFSSGPDTMQLQRQQQQYQQLQQRRKHNALLTTITTTYPEPIVPTESLDEGLALKRLSMVVAAMVSALPWTGALGTRPYARSDACSSVYSGKQLEEMELGERTRPGRSKSCTERRHSRQGSGDEDDVETESEDHLHDSLGEEDEGDNEQEDEEEDEEDSNGQQERSYWTLLRGTSNGNRRRHTRSVGLMEKEQEMHGQVQHSTCGSHNRSHAAVKARRRTGAHSRNLSPSPFPSLDAEVPASSISPPITSSTMAESYGTSGLLMLSFFILFLFLLESTNQIQSVQSTLLSIIL